MDDTPDKYDIVERHVDENGLYHRIGGPAIRYVDGGWTWSIHGYHHRLDGPSDYNPSALNSGLDPLYVYSINGTPFTLEEFKRFYLITFLEEYDQQAKENPYLPIDISTTCAIVPT